MEYDILVAADADELSVLVNEAIQDGWSPIGGASPAPGAIQCPSGRPYTSDGVMQTILRVKKDV